MKNAYLKLAVMMTMMMPSWAFATAEGDAADRDLFWFLGVVRSLASESTFTAKLIFAAMGFIIFGASVFAFKAAGNTNDPSKTKGAATGGIVIGLVLMSAGVYAAMGTKTFGGNTDQITQWETEWNSGADTGGGL